MNKKGFTVIELIVGILLVGIFMGLAVTSVSFIKDSRFKNDGFNMLMNIRYTKDLSMIKGYQHKMVFNQDGYTIVDEYGETIKSYKFSKGVFFEDSELSRGPLKVNYISYNIDGSPEETGTLIISNSSKKLRFSITPVTGRVSMSKI